MRTATRKQVGECLEAARLAVTEKGTKSSSHQALLVFGRSIILEHVLHFSKLHIPHL